MPFPGGIRAEIRGSVVAVDRLPPPPPAPPPPTFTVNPIVQATPVEAAAVEQFIEQFILELEQPYWPNGWCIWPYWGVSLPLWMLFLFFAVPTALLLWRDRRRIPPGHCQHCGYDLTGNISGRCPECGQTVAPSAREMG
jgi:hypothetical protein